VCEPWTPYAQYKWKVEQELSNIADLNYIVVRPAIVYGPGDRTGLSMYSVCGFYDKCILVMMHTNHGHSWKLKFPGLESHEK